MSTVVLGAYLLSGQPGYRQAGVHHYARNLLRALARALPADLTLTTLISPTATDELTPHEHAALRVKVAARTTEAPVSRIRTEQFDTPRLLTALNARLYHGLGFVAPLRAPCPTVVSVMDLSFLTHPATHRPFNRLYLSALTRLSCQAARHVIAISEWTRRDIIQRFALPAERVSAIPLGVDHDLFHPPPPDRVAAFRAEHGIGPRAIFSLGSIEPRKNLPRLLDAFATLPGDAQLFIGGSAAWKTSATYERIAALGPRVRLLGRIDDAHLPLWHAACGVFAYPSLYEGFGLPALEAMACGSAVVASNASSLPEVVGDAGLLVDPTDTRAIATALGRVLDDATLRLNFGARALARAQRFTWASTAARTLDVHRRCLI